MKKENRKSIRMFMMTVLFLLFLCFLSGCERQKKQDIPIDLGTIDISEIEKIEVSGTTGGRDGTFSHTLSESECNDFVGVLHQVELGSEVEEEQALANGAVTYYTLYFFEKDPITISPGQYFEIEGSYYKFVNYDEIWEKFIYFNSLR